MIEWELVFDILDALCPYVAAAKLSGYRIGDANADPGVEPGKEDDLAEMLALRYGEILGGSRRNT